MSYSILVIPDIQAKPGQKLRHLEHLAKFIRKIKPDCIVQLGDLWDYPSLSSYDRKKKASEGKRLIADHNIGCKAARMITPRHNCRLIFTKGNHEYRVDLYENDYPELEGALPNCMSYMTSLGWEAYGFLDVVKVRGVSFSHFFPRASTGNVTASSQRNGASTALNMLKANMTSCVAGHKQGLDSALFNAPDGRKRGIIAGSFYTHDEKYLGPQGNNYWRGVLLLNNVKNGDFDLTEVSLEYLRKKYG